MDAADLFGGRKQDDGKAGDAYDARSKEKGYETLDHLEIHLSAHSKISDFSCGRR